MTSRLFVVLLLGACSDSPNLTDPTDATPIGMTSAEVPLPTKGTYDVWGSFTDAPANCAGAGARHAGGGVETHTGRYTITTHDCIIGADFTGSFIKVAANGDELTGTYAGTTEVLEPPPFLVLAVTGTISFTGGTGRFAGATGTQAMFGRQTIDFTASSPVIHTVLKLTDGTLVLP
jgi:hypothetical protein